MAFVGCISLTGITIPDSVTTIRDGAFNYCNSLNSIDVSVDNQNYSSENGVLFDKNKTKLIRFPTEKKDKVYIIPDSVTTIADRAFSGCIYLQSITIPDSITTIDEYTFWNCTSLTSITIPDSITAIEEGAFYDCSSLKSVTIPNSVTKIDEMAFHNCTSLKSVTLPNSVIKIGDKAFGYYWYSNDECKKIDGFHIYCNKNTLGKRYANANKFDYTLLETDVNKVEE